MEHTINDLIESLIALRDGHGNMLVMNASLDWLTITTATLTVAKTDSFILSNSKAELPVVVIF